MHAESPPLGPIPAEAAGPNIDPAAATRAYLATISPEAKVNSDAYFEGGYWLVLWDALFSFALGVLLLATGWSAAWRDRAESFVSWRWAQVSIYAAIYTVVATVISFPLTAYQLYFREHQYHMATQTFGPWFSEQAKGAIYSDHYDRHRAADPLRGLPARSADLVALGNRGDGRFPRGLHGHRADLHRHPIQHV